MDSMCNIKLAGRALLGLVEVESFQEALEDPRRKATAREEVERGWKVKLKARTKQPKTELRLEGAHSPPESEGHQAGRQQIVRRKKQTMGNVLHTYPSFSGETLQVKTVFPHSRK